MRSRVAPFTGGCSYDASIIETAWAHPLRKPRYLTSTRIDTMDETGMMSYDVPYVLLMCGICSKEGADVAQQLGLVPSTA